MSKTPSWVMLGFVLGAAFVVALPEWRKEQPAVPVKAPPRVEQPRPPAAPRPPPPLSRIDAVFEEWGRYAAWHDDTTEVALWDPAEERFADYYEVRRVNGVLYFRSITKLTRRIIVRGKQLTESPLQFTETEEQYRDWDDRDRAERPMQRMWQEVAKQRSQEQPEETPSPVPASPEVRKITPAFDPPKPGTGGSEK
ncbi:MAG: hypothetical protein WD941_02375 [Opitutus sp.]